MNPYTQLKQVVTVILTVLVLAGGTVGLAGCEREGPAERLGKDIDRTAENLRETFHRPGPAEKAGKEIDRSAEEARERANRAADEFTR